MPSSDTQFKPGQSGNPKGTSREQVFLRLLKEAEKESDWKRVRGAVEHLLNKAADGEQWAIQMLADRLDGKPAQAIVNDGDGAPFFIKIMPADELI